MTKYILDDDVAAYVAQCSPLTGDTSSSQEPAEVNIDALRKDFDAQCQLFAEEIPAGMDVYDEMVVGTSETGETSGPIPIRVYRPSSIEGQSKPLGCILYFHGGGWVLGNLDSHASIAADLSQRTGAVVIVVDYRLGPEHLYPAGHEDCWAVLQAVAGDPAHYDIDPQKIIVCGDSAGGNLAAAMALMARDKWGSDRPKLAGQVLLYSALGGIGTLPSYEVCHDAPLLTTEDMHVFHEMYFGARQLPDDPIACPLKVENLEELPSAFINCAQYDPLRDDSVEYARRLEAAGISVEFHLEEGLIHAFLRARHTTNRGKLAFDRICSGIQKLLQN